MSTNSNKLVVITGAASGFGKEMSVLFSSKGYKVAMLSQTAAKLDAIDLPGVFKKAVDVRDRDGLDKAIDEAEQFFKLSVDCLINNAGIMPLGDMDKQDPAEWDKMIDVNIKGVLNGIYAVYRKMINRQRGTIINISSIAGKKVFDQHAVYCGSKFAVHAISDQLRKEAGQHNIRVITIAPGAAETNLLASTSNKEIVNNYDTWKVSMGGALSAKSVADSILFTYEMPQDVCIRELVISAVNQGD
jgi:NADP-dependent 3-hydroxy acid dehydrogenase YdfG